MARKIPVAVATRYLGRLRTPNSDQVVTSRDLKCNPVTQSKFGCVCCAHGDTSWLGT
ncbi:hypothetical protein BDR06DRAFT_963272 [Suillus hirtellus]|nr:hypothetical protein BDR06DRAFT_963272 [Suillus hirtellus]